MKIDKLEEIGFKHDATVVSKSSADDDLKGEIITSMYHIPNKRLMVLVDQHDIRYAHFDDDCRYISIRIIFAIPTHCKKHVLWGSYSKYSGIPEEDCFDCIKLVTDNLSHSGSSSSGVSDDKSTIIYDYQCNLKTRPGTSDDVFNEIKALHDKIISIIADGVFSDLQVTSFEPSDCFKQCSQAFWDEINRQCDFNAIVKKPWGFLL